MKAWSVRSWTAYALLLVLPAMALSTVYSGDFNTLCTDQCVNSSVPMVIVLLVNVLMVSVLLVSVLLISDLLGECVGDGGVDGGVAFRLELQYRRSCRGGGCKLQLGVR